MPLTRFPFPFAHPHTHSTSRIPPLAGSYSCLPMTEINEAWDACCPKQARVLPVSGSFRAGFAQSPATPCWPCLPRHPWNQRKAIRQAPVERQQERVLRLRLEKPHQTALGGRAMLPVTAAELDKQEFIQIGIGVIGDHVQHPNLVEEASLWLRCKVPNAYIDILLSVRNIFDW